MLALPPLAPDGRRYLTAAQAGEMFGVGAPAVRRWHAIGYFPAGTVIGDGRNKLYEMTACADAELLAREAAERTSGTVKRAERHFSASAA